VGGSQIQPYSTNTVPISATTPGASSRVAGRIVHGAVMARLLDDIVRRAATAVGTEHRGDLPPAVDPVQPMSPCARLGEQIAAGDRSLGGLEPV
jgi:hypothetical protein